MSATTGTIQRPIGQGSIFGTVALAAVVLLAVLAVTWGAMNLASTKSVAAPLAATAVLDKGSRGEIAPVAAPAPASILDRGSRDDLAKSIPQVNHTNTGRHLPPTSIPRGARAS